MTVFYTPNYLIPQIQKDKRRIRLTQPNICKEHLKLVQVVTPICFIDLALVIEMASITEHSVEKAKRERAKAYLEHLNVLN